ncbi:MAG: SDR family oxidoreductase [Alphaproteobacteria bacterium]|nr:SDR family oxidoreductase [Alphaproteobacteria bacterium]
MPDPDSSPRLFCFGLGYSASRLADKLQAAGWAIAGTCRSPEIVAGLRNQGFEAFLFDGDRPLEDAEDILRGTTHLLSSVPPGQDDPVLSHHREDIAAIDGLKWAGYLSTTGVYGDTGGALVDETAPLNPTSERARRRVEAEEAWLSLFHDHGVPVHVFRLAGIYGPGRSALDQVQAGRARRILKPGHLFSRIHVDDIGQIVRASMDNPHPGHVYNLGDDQPASPADVIGFACELLDVVPLPVIDFEEAAKDMSPMGLSFWQDNRRIDNARFKNELGITLLYPDYREGLRAIKAEDGKGEA